MWTGLWRAAKNRRAKRYGRWHDNEQLWYVLQRAGQVHGSRTPASACACHLGGITWSGAPKRCRRTMQCLNGVETRGQILRGRNRAASFLGHLGKGLWSGASKGRKCPQQSWSSSEDTTELPRGRIRFSAFARDLGKDLLTLT